MSISVPAFWALAEESRLLPPRACADLRQRWLALKGAERSASARTLAEWLVAEGELTRYQARLLLEGQPGPFYYGEYLVVKRLHRGGLQDCYQAVHAPTRFPVTLRFVRGKCFEPTTDMGEIRRLLEAGPKADRIVVPFYEWVDCGAYQFGVFGRLAGRPVSEMVAERGKLDLATALRIVHDAAAGIAPLHVAGNPHGAVRPDSIWLTEDHRVRVLPRQLCESWDSLRGRKSWLAAGGDPAALTVAQFTAPEAAGRSALASPRADVYSLGCVLYTLLSGRPPFLGNDVAEILQQHASEPPPPLSRRGLPKDLGDVLVRMLAKDEAARLPDAQAAAEVLARLGEASEAHEVAVGSRADGVDAAVRCEFVEWIGRRPAAPPWINTANSERPGVPLAAAFPAPADLKSLPVAKPVNTVVNRGATSAASSRDGRIAGPERGSPPVVSSRSPRKRRIDWTAIGLSLLLASVAAGGVLLWHANRDARDYVEANGPATSGVDITLTPSTAGDKADEAGGLVNGGAPPRERRIPDDGQTLWASPTSGEPLSAAFLPPGTQGILSVRPAELFAHPQGERVRTAVGPQMASVVDRLRPFTGFAADEIAQLIVGWRAGRPLGTDNLFLVLRPTAEGRDLSYSDLQQRLEGTTEVQVEGQVALLRDERAYYLAADEEGPVLVVCPEDVLAEIASLSGTPPPLQREMEELLAASDAERQVTLMLAPRLLLGDGRDFLTHHAQVLREPVHWFFGEKTQAVMISGHWDENFFVELQAIAAADMPPWDLRAALEQRLAELPTRVGDHVLTANLQTYGLRIVGRLPEMLRRVVAYSRSAVEGDRAVLRCYLPRPAGHNLLMASELLLAETFSNSVVRSAARPPDAPQSVEGRLAQVTSLSFSRDTLEAAVEALAKDAGVPLEIRGNDLQLEGITKNQSFPIDAHGRPVREILIEVLRLANPDKTATSAKDPRQKLVFTIEPDAAGQDTIYVTTRKAAEQRGVTLPPEFEVPP